MRRVTSLATALGVAAAGLAAVSLPRTAEALTALDCLDSPFGRTMPIDARESVAVDYVDSGSHVVHKRWEPQLSGVFGADGFSAYVYPPPTDSGTMAASTSAILNADGTASGVRLVGAVGSTPHLRTEKYLQPSGLSQSSTTPMNTDNGTAGLGPASAVALTAGNVLGPMSDADWTALKARTELDQVVAAWRSPTGPGLETVNVRLFKSTDATGIVGMRVSPLGGHYQSYGEYTGSSLQQNLAVTTADLTGDGSSEVIVAYQWAEDDPIRIDVLRATGDGSSLTKLTTTWVGGGYPITSIRLASGDFGSFRQGFAIAWSDDNPSHDSPNERPVDVRTFVLNPSNSLVQTGSRTFSARPVTSDNPYFDLAAGDVDGQTQPPIGGSSGTPLPADDELVLAYADAGAHVVVLDSGSSTLATKESFLETSGYNSSQEVSGLAVGVGDVNYDPHEDILLAYNDSSGKNRLTQVKDKGSGQLTAGYRYTGTLSNAKPLPVVMADFSGTTARATLSGVDGAQVACEDVLEPVVLSASDAVPYWANAQDPLYGMSYVARTKSTTSTTASSVTHTLGHTLTMSTGLDAELPDAIPVVGDLFAAEAELQYQVEKSFSRSTAAETSDSIYNEVMDGWGNYSEGTGLAYTAMAYRCYFYGVNSAYAQYDSRVRACFLNDDEPHVGVQYNASSHLWETTGGPASSPSSRNWLPVRPEWSDEALFGATATQRGGAGTRAAALAIDGDTDQTDKTTSSKSSSVTNPWWQVDLGSTRDLGVLRIWPSADFTCQSDGQCTGALRDFDVYVFDDPSLAAVDDPSVFDSDPDVLKLHWDGMPGRVVNFSTLQADGDGFAGRYVRVQQKSSAATTLGLSEVQAFGASSHVEPPEYPADVRAGDEDGLGGDYLEVKLWNPATQAYEWKRMRGKLLGVPDLTWKGVQNGCDTQSLFEYSRGEESGSATEISTSEETSSGGSVELAAGLSVLKAVAGVGSQHSYGVESASSHETVVGDDFTLGGWQSGFCSEGSPNAVLPSSCSYSYKPFYYQLTDYSDADYHQNYIYVSYLVNMDRSKRLSNCYDGQFRVGVNQPPAAPDVQVTTSPGQLVDIPALDNATDPNPEDAGALSIAGLAQTDTGPLGAAVTLSGASISVHGTSISYSPVARWQSGTDEFYYRITDGDTVSDPIKVTVTVASPPAELLQNGDLEAGSAPWTLLGGAARVETSLAHSPSHDFALAYTASSVSSQLSVPTAGTPTFTFWKRATTTWGSGLGSHLDLQVIDGTTTTTLDSWTPADSPEGTWVKYSIDLSQFAGKAVTVKFAATEGANSAVTFRLDDFSLKAY